MAKREYDYYSEIDAALKVFEEGKPYLPKTIDWICNRIDWCWKWRKITEPEMEELAERATNVLENMIERMRY